MVGSELGSCGALVASPHTQACSAGVLHGRRSERAPRPPGFSIWFMIQSDDLTCNTHSMICNDLCKRLYNTRKLLVFFIAATVFGSLEVAETVAANAQRRFRGPGKLAAGRADVCPPMALNASQSATPSAPTADVQSAAGCDDQQ